MSDRTDELRRRANTGDGDAQYQLAQALWTGDGVAADREQAIIWYRRAAGTDNPAYQLSFGLVLCWYGDMDNFRKGFRWILRAAQNGHVGAQYFVASEYARGEHIPKNSFEAAHWYRSAGALRYRR